MNSYDTPCDEMKLVTTIMEMNSPFKSSLKIKFMHMSDSYEEIINHREFGFEMFWSSIGGFIGICLGYSLLQIPEFLSAAWQWYRNNYFTKRIIQVNLNIITL